jgi:glycosyltransferase involved in cell wall biosynthesis
MKITLAVRQKFHGFNLAEEISSHGFLKNLYTSYYGSFLGKRNNNGFTIPNSIVRTNLYCAFKTYVFRNNSLDNDNYFGNWVSKLLKDEDIVITWGIQAMPIILRAKQLGIKVILERGSSHVRFQRDILLEEYKLLNLSTVKIESSFSERRMDREMMEYDLADIVSIPSSFVSRTFDENGFSNKKLFLNPYGTNLVDFGYSPISHKPFRLIYAGSLSIRKGLHYLLEAFSALKLPESELWLVGNLDEEVELIVSKYRFDNVKIFKPVSQKDLSYLYNQCDVFIICSIEEGMAMVQAQAMACGLPIICTTNTGGDDLIQDGVSGFVIPIRDLKILKEKIEYLYVNREYCKFMGEMAQKAATINLSWKDYGNRAIDFYNKLLISS